MPDRELSLEESVRAVRAIAPTLRTDAEREAMVLNLARWFCGSLGPAHFQPIADLLFDELRLPRRDLAAEITAKDRFDALLREQLADARALTAEGAPERRRCAMSRDAVRRLCALNPDRDDLQHAAGVLSAALGVEIDVEKALATRSLDLDLGVCRTQAERAGVALVDCAPDVEPWAEMILHKRHQGQLDTPKALERERDRARSAFGPGSLDPDQRAQDEQRLDWALSAPLDEVDAALRTPPVERTPINRIDKKVRHERVRLARARPRERRASRSSRTRSRSSPDDSGGSDSEPPAALAQPLPLHAVAVLLELGCVPYWIDAADLVISAWCPSCSGAQGCWFTPYGVSCGGGCEPDQVLDGLLGLPVGAIWLDGSK